MNTILFILNIATLWFWLGSRVGAATPPAAKEFKPVLTQSTYDTTPARDPFANRSLPAPTTTTGTPTVVAANAPLNFHLDGILYQAKNPSASVNGQLLTLNKTVKLDAGFGEIPVKAVVITRDHVVLEANGQKVELRLNPNNGQLPGATR